MRRLRIGLAVLAIAAAAAACGGDGASPSDGTSPATSLATPPPATGDATPGY